MKRILTLPLLVLLMGCAAIKTGHDPVVVRAEQTVKIAFDVCDAFLMFEHANRQTLPKEIQAFATSIRTEGKAAFKSARALTKAYKYNRTPENKANLETAIAVIQALQTEAAAYLAALPKGTQ